MSNDATLAEARGLYRMLGNGHTLEELRECIGVPPNIERMLRRYATLNLAEARWIEKILKFRKSVAKDLICWCARAPRLPNYRRWKKRTRTSARERLQMHLTRQQSYALLEKRGCYVTEVCDKCGQILGPVRFTWRDDKGVWCSRECRDGVMVHELGTCRHCKAKLPEDKRRGTVFCDDACRKASQRPSGESQTVRTSKLSRTNRPIYAGFCTDFQPPATTTPEA